MGDRSAAWSACVLILAVTLFVLAAVAPAATTPNRDAKLHLVAVDVRPHAERDRVRPG